MRTALILLALLWPAQPIAPCTSGTTVIYNPRLEAPIALHVRGATITDSTLLGRVCLDVGARRCWRLNIYHPHLQTTVVTDYTECGAALPLVTT